MVLDLIQKNGIRQEEFLSQTIEDFSQDQTSKEEPGFANAQDKDEILAWLKS